MATLHNLGFPRIGEKRELKFALEKFWRGEITASELKQNAKSIREKNWQLQSELDFAPVGDFSFYDHVLDTSFLLGNIPERAKSHAAEHIDQYFRVARGRSANDSACNCIHAGEMTKWFDTNYHYIVPEITQDTVFSLNADALIAQVAEAQRIAQNVKPVILGPVTYLWLCKEKDNSSRLDFLAQLLPIYKQLIDSLVKAGAEWIQIDEPILVTDIEEPWQKALITAYDYLQTTQAKLLLATYFGKLEENIALASSLPVAGIHLDAIRAKEEVTTLIDLLPKNSVISLGVVDGRNIWKTDLISLLDWLEPISDRLKDRLWIAPSCSLLHVPVNLESEETLDVEIKRWLAFAKQKLSELKTIHIALTDGRKAVANELSINQQAVISRKTSPRVHKLSVKEAVNSVTPSLGERKSPYSVRASIQRPALNLPKFPTTTIGSFPQTPSIRQTRLAYKKGELNSHDYEKQMKQEIAHAIEIQNQLGLDVLVHGEAERNDMVEYFGEQLAGCVFSQFGWVQSYGSRCVKPPILFGDIERPTAMTVKWTQFAQSLTDKPMKGMLTGPVTILNWSFVRDDQPRSETCLQLALAIRKEVQDLEEAGVKLIQIDEAALREGLPLRKSDWQHYLDWAVECYRISANGVKDETQIHTHMCYSEFNDIIAAIAHMDADVITIETSRSDMELLDVFEQFSYPNDIGPGVYDIHTPNIPSVEQMTALMTKASQRIPVEQLWVNPDCGLKTRRWEEVVPALENMVRAAKILRQNVA